MSFEYPISVAPMMAHTDRHLRYFLRLLTKRTLLYTEMVNQHAIRHGKRTHLLDFSPEEHPLSLQLGGDDPEALSDAARIGQEWGYDEINLNVGCPSDRVQSGNFGACLMRDPALVANLVTTMQAAVSIPVTVKHRIGVDDLDAYEDMENFVRVVSETGCTRFSVHARKAWLQGLSPKQNRNVPPLRYDDVYRLKKAMPELVIEINGGVKTYADIDTHLEHVDAVMIGRTAYEDPFFFAQMDTRYFGEAQNPVASRHEAVEAMFDYIQSQCDQGVRLNHIARHLLSLFNGMPGARSWRRHLSENAVKDGAGLEVVKDALALMSRDAGDIARTG